MEIPHKVGYTKMNNQLSFMDWIKGLMGLLIVTFICIGPLAIMVNIDQARKEVEIGKELDKIIIQHEKDKSQRDIARQQEIKDFDNLVSNTPAFKDIL
jgi:hypothetical protein